MTPPQDPPVDPLAPARSEPSDEAHDAGGAAGMTVGGPGGDEVVVVPWPLLLRRRVADRVRSSDRFRWIVLATVLFGLLSVNLSFTIFAVALPRVARELGTTENALTWVITGPLLAYGVIAPTAGKLGDLYGHRRLYLLGMVGALVATALSAVAWGALVLIAFRIAAAAAGAATGAASMALIFRAFPREDRVKAMGWWSLVGAGGPVLGVAVGGPIIEAFGWRWVFAIQVPLALAAVVLAAMALPETPRGESARLDVPGAATLTAAVLALLVALNRGAEPGWGWSHPVVVAGFVLAPVLLTCFVAVERKAAAPLLPLAYLRRRNFALPIAAQACANFAYMGGFILAPSLLERVFGYGEARIGLLVVPRPLAFSLAAPIAGYLAVRLGERRTSVAGTLAVVASMVAFAAVGPTTSDLAIAVALALSGIGLGAASPSIASSVANAVDEADLGIASAAQQLVAQVAIVAGIQLMRTVVAAGGDASLAPAAAAAAFRPAYLLGAGVALAGVAAAAGIRSAPARR